MENGLVMSFFVYWSELNKANPFAYPFLITKLFKIS